jgi:thioredoxin-related protein
MNDERDEEHSYMTAIRRTFLRMAACALLSFLIPRSSFLVAQEVPWRHDYNAARREAKEKSRPLVLDFGTERCFWCAKLDATTLRDPAVVRVLTEQFVALKLDAARDGALADLLRVQSYPTLVLAAPDGRILATLEGYVDAERLKEQLRQVLAAVANPDGMRRDYQEATASPRTQRARELLAQAREDHRAQQYLCCLERCATLANGYGDLAEAAEALQLAAEIKNNPDWLQRACQSLSDQLGELYLSLADNWLRRGQPQQAALCLERVLQTLPGTRHAEVAQLRLAQIQGQPTQRESLRKP